MADLLDFMRPLSGTEIKAITAPVIGYVVIGKTFCYGPFNSELRANRIAGMLHWFFDTKTRVIPLQEWS